MDETLGEMLQTIFPLHTDEAILEWHGRKTALNYKYDISMMLEDILRLLQELDANPSGKSVVAWVSNSFPYRWEVDWMNGTVSIRSSPLDPSRTGLPGIGLISGEIRGFVAEWRPVLNIIRSAAMKAGYDLSRFQDGKVLLTLQNKDLR